MASVSIGLTIYRGGLVIISGGDPAVVEAISTQRVRASSIHDKWDNSDRFIGVRLEAPIVRYRIEITILSMQQTCRGRRNRVIMPALGTIVLITPY